MSAEKQGTLLKYCDCENMKKPMIIGQMEMKKRSFVTGVVLAFLLLTVFCGFMQYTYVKLNNIEAEFRRVDQALQKMMKKYYEHEPDDGSHFIVPLYDLIDDDAVAKDYDDVYEEYMDFDNLKDYEPTTNFTKDLKQEYQADSDQPNENEFDENDLNNDKILNKRSVVAATKDGVLINSESYAEIKAKNSSKNKTANQHYRGKSVSAIPAKPSTFGHSWTYPQRSKEEINAEARTEGIEVTEVPLVATQRPSVSVRRSRVMHTEDSSKAFRKVLRKPVLKSGDMEYESYRSDEISSTESPVTQDSALGKHKKLGRTRPLISIQFNGDTSKYIFGKHENFRGNGQLRHPQRNFVDWVPSDWVGKTGMDAHFLLNQGVVTIKESGLYFVYAQIYYLDEHDRTGFRIYKNTDMILQCTITQHSSERITKGNTCYTAGVEFLGASDTIYLSDVTPGKYSLFEPGKSFFGLIKLGDFKNK